MLRHLAIPFVAMTMLLTSACQTSMVKEFEEVKPGMEKAEVLAIMGSPQQTQRYHGKDRWFYNFYDSHIRFQKEVQFFEGNAIYVGERWEPPTNQSAFAVDAKNAKQDQDAAEQLAKDQQQHRNDYDNYQSKSHGEDKVRYVPTFEQIR